MITLADFKKYEELEQQLEEFLCEKCNEFKEAKLGSIESLETPNKINFWEFNENNIIIWFFGKGHFDDEYSYKLSLEHLFDPEFKQIMKAHFEEERRKEELKILEYQKQHAEKLKVKAEQKRHEEIELMKELIKKYPDELKEVN